VHTFLCTFDYAIQIKNAAKSCTFDHVTIKKFPFRTITYY
jgi:hypothetical protein